MKDDCRGCRWPVLLWLTVTYLSVACGSTGAENPLLSELVQQGVAVTPAVNAVLPSPSLVSGEEPSRRQAKLQQLADRFPLEEFLRRSIVAPFVLKISSVTASDGQRVGQAVDLWFAAHGRLDTVRSQALLRELGPAQPAQADALAPRFTTLTSEQLTPYRLAPIESPERRDSYVAVQSPVLDRVLVRGVLKIVETSTTESSTVAMQLDSRFEVDPVYRPHWRTVRPDEFGELQAGPSQPYQGLGGYVQATQLDDPPGALLIEAHVVFQEPREWFSGTNQLRSKLPIAVQDQVRSFRRKLAARELQEPRAP